MSAFVKTVRICLLITAACCASTLADERSNPSLLTPAASNEDMAVARVAIDQAAIGNEWDYRAAPVLAALTVSAPERAQEPDAAEPETTWQRVATIILPDSTAKWTELQSRILADKASIAACRTGERPCSTAAKRFLAIVDSASQRRGKARFGEINRAVNLSIRPVSDMVQYGVEDYWASPLQSLGSGKGDCEDYAIAKYVALEEAGVARDDLQLEIVRDVEHQATHAVVTVRYKNEWLVLDNRTLLMKNADATPYQYLVALDHDGARTFTAEVARRRTVPTGAAVSALQDGHAVVMASKLAMTGGSHKVD